MNRFSYGSFNPENTDAVFTDVSYTDPISETVTRKQLSYPLKEIKDYINKTTNIDSSNNVVQLKLDYENSALYYSTDGTNFNEVDFYGEQGQPGQGVAEGGTTGQFLVKASDDDYDTGWETLDVQSLISNIFPVGYVYISVTNVSPSVYFGGTWEQITTDAYLKIVTENGGVAGGTSSEHKIPLASMPAHTHTVTDAYNYSGDMGWNPSSYLNKSVESTSTTRTTSEAGGGDAYYPYYIGVYVWKRVA